MVEQFVDWAFKGLVSGGLGFGVYVLYQMNQNISQLNAHVAVLLTSDKNREESIKDHEKRLRSLEKINAR